jgi:hypothetical protein
MTVSRFSRAGFHSSSTCLQKGTGFIYIVYDLCLQVGVHFEIYDSQTNIQDFWMRFSDLVAINTTANFGMNTLICKQKIIIGKGKNMRIIKEHTFIEKRESTNKIMHVQMDKKLKQMF